MDQPFIGTISLFGGNFAPRGWALCDGQLLSISQNSALFAILGTTYGGNGTTNFQLPDLRGRGPIHWGQGPGLTPRVIGEFSGSENVTLLNSEMPLHNHLMMTTAVVADQPNPGGNYLAKSIDPDAGGNPLDYKSATDGSTLAPQAISVSGGNQPHNNMAPYLAVTYIIALVGIFPSRN